MRRNRSLLAPLLMLTAAFVALGAATGRLWAAGNALVWLIVVAAALIGGGLLLLVRRL